MSRRRRDAAAANSSSSDFGAWLGQAGYDEASVSNIVASTMHGSRQDASLVNWDEMEQVCAAMEGRHARIEILDLKVDEEEGEVSFSVDAAVDDASDSDSEASEAALDATGSGPGAQGPVLHSAVRQGAPLLVARKRLGLSGSGAGSAVSSASSSPLRPSTSTGTAPNAAQGREGRASTNSLLAGTDLPLALDGAGAATGSRSGRLASLLPSRLAPAAAGKGSGGALSRGEEWRGGQEAARERRGGGLMRTGSLVPMRPRRAGTTGRAENAEGSGSMAAEGGAFPKSRSREEGAPVVSGRLLAAAAEREAAAWSPVPAGGLPQGGSNDSLPMQGSLRLGGGKRDPQSDASSASSAASSATVSPARQVPRQGRVPAVSPLRPVTSGRVPQADVPPPTELMSSFTVLTPAPPAGHRSPLPGPAGALTGAATCIPEGSMADVAAFLDKTGAVIDGIELTFDDMEAESAHRCKCSSRPSLESVTVAGAVACKKCANRGGHVRQSSWGGAGGAEVVRFNLVISNAEKVHLAGMAWRAEAGKYFTVSGSNNVVACQ